MTHLSSAGHRSSRPVLTDHLSAAARRCRHALALSLSLVGVGAGVAHAQSGYGIGGNPPSVYGSQPSVYGSQPSVYGNPPSVYGTLPPPQQPGSVPAPPFNATPPNATQPSTAPVYNGQSVYPPTPSAYGQQPPQTVYQQPSRPDIYPEPTVYGSQPYGSPGQSFDGGGSAFTGSGLPLDGSFPSTNFPSIGPAAPIVTPTVQTADLIVQGYPARTGRIMFGGAVNSDAGVTGQVTIDERNFDITRWPRSFQDLASGTAFRGAGQTFRLEAQPGNLFQRYTVSFADPNLLGYLPISMNVSGFYYDRRFNDWDEGRLGGRLSFGYRITPDLSISAGVTGQNVEISNPSIGGVPQLDDVLGDNTLFTGMTSLVHDTRNSPLLPSQGHFIRASYEQAFGDFDYGRLEGEYRKYFLLSERADGSGKQTLTFGTQLGFSGDETPIFENFFAGGYATMRGFDFRGANPVVQAGGNRVEVGGRFQWLNTVEYMFPLTADDAFRGVAFVDFGTVEEDIEINADNFRVAPGVGIRVAIPMLGPAPLAFDFAFPIAQAEFDDERIFTFYMSAVR